MPCPEALPSALGALAAAIARGRSDEEVGMIAAALVQLGDSLAIVLAQRACEKSKLENGAGAVK